MVALAGCVFSSCSINRTKPCTHGGQPAREPTSAFQGIKKCYQARDKFGVLLNDGKYYEWFNNDKIALTGEYKMGKKTGRWIVYDEDGKKVSDQYFEEGKEVAAP